MKIVLFRVDDDVVAHADALTHDVDVVPSNVVLLVDAVHDV